jgi:hypothetical protein
LGERIWHALRRKPSADADNDPDNTGNGANKEAA